MGIKDSIEGSKETFEEAFDVNIVNRYGESERFLDRIYKGVIDLGYGASTVLTRTWRGQFRFFER
jgi:hypothetical protein